MSEARSAVSTRHELARRLLERAQTTPTIPARDPALPVPLSHSQEQVWIVDKLHGRSAAFNEVAAIELRGALNPEVLDQALTALVERHDALRTLVIELDGEPHQVQSAPGPVSAARRDVGSCTEATGAASVLIAAVAAEPFDLAHGPLFRPLLIRMGHNHHVLALVTHHLVTDGWSIRIMLRDLMAAYAQAGGKQVELPRLATTYADYAAWQRQPRHAVVQQRQLEYWRGQLAGAPDSSELPTDHARPHVQAHAGARMERHLTSDTAAAVEQLARSAGCTTFTVLLTALATVIGRHSGASEVVIGSTVANRGHQELEEVVGCFVNTIALRLPLPSATTAEELLRMHHQVVVDGLSAQDVPFSSVVDATRTPRDLSRNPLFQVMLTLHNQPFSPVTLPHLEATAFEGRPARTKVDLDLSFVPTPDGGLRMVLDFDQALFELQTIDRFARRLLRVLDRMARRPGVLVEELSEPTQHEHDEWVLPWQKPVTGTRSLSLAERFDKVAASRRDAIAVVSADGRTQLSYLALDRLGDDLAARLTAHGVARGDLVGVVCDREPELAVALLGIIKAGAAYVPISAGDPPERVAGVLTQASLRCVVTGTSNAATLAEAGPAVTTVPAVTGPPSHRSAGAIPGGALTGSDLAYVVFTSGSTGVPKGVMVSHDNVGRLLDDTRQVLGDHEADVRAMVHYYGFDVSVWEFWGSLLQGGRLVVCDQETVRSPALLAATLQRHGVTVLCQTPSALSLLLDHDRGVGVSTEALRLVIVAGERFDFRSLANWAERHDLAAPRFVNMLGPTETTVYATYREVGVDDLARTRSFVGRPLPSSRLLAVDDVSRVVVDGMTGELLIGGTGVAWGYLGQPARTAERFVPDPTGAGARVYRTGDLVRPEIGPDFEYLGRIDTQVKLRGYRIELGEIETVLQFHPEVVAAAVAKIGEPGADERLAAWVSLQPGTELDPPDLRVFLSRRLPSYMLPAEIALVDALPRTASGKLDRVALTQLQKRPPSEASDSTGHRTGAATARWRSEIERLVALHWSRLIGLDEISPDANVFELGAHSLLAVRFQSALAEEGLVVELHELFAAPTARGLAALLEHRHATPTGAASPVSGAAGFAPVADAEHSGATDPEPAQDAPTAGERRRSARTRQLSAERRRRT